MSGATGQVLMLDGSDVDDLLPPSTCIAAIEAAFRVRSGGAGRAAGVLGWPAGSGGFHLKAAGSADGRYFAAKVNANFPENPRGPGLPTIQGLVLLFDGTTGTPLAILDSVRITALRTAAASAVAARYLAREDARHLFIIGCGTQARAHVDAMQVIRSIERITLYDLDPTRAQALATALRGRFPVRIAAGIPEAREAGIVVTCTPSHQPILEPEHVSGGAFIAAVGADNEHKQEIAPALMARARVVVDALEQCMTMGDLRGAIEAGAMRREDVFAELGDIVAGRRTGRLGDDDVVVFDSTGVAFEDVAAASVVYERALESGRGTRVSV